MAHALSALDIRMGQASADAVLQTARLTLRPLRAGDAETLRLARRPAGADPVSALLTDDLLRDLCAAAAAEWAASGMGQFLVFEREGTAPIGLIRLGAISGAAAGRMADLTYAINTTHRGRGYGTEAVGAVLAFAFEEAHLDYVVARVEPENQRSVRVAEANGMVSLGEGRHGHRIMRRYVVAGSAWRAQGRTAPHADPALHPTPLTRN